MDTINSKIIGLIAGDGELPVNHAQAASEQGFEVFVISYSPENRKQLEKYCKKVLPCGPGEIQKAVDFAERSPFPEGCNTKEHTYK